MGGGPSTPALVAAVGDAGGLGFLAAGYKTAGAMREEIAAVRASSSAPFGVNVFVPSAPFEDRAAVDRYVAELEPDAARYGVSPGEPRWTDDDWEAKLEAVAGERPAAVSFTFGCPGAEVVEGLRAQKIAVWCTVTTPGEAEEAGRAGVDALVVQGAEAGAHQGSFVDDDDRELLPLLTLLELVRAVSDLPLVATGGIATSAAVGAVLAAGASAAQLGTAFLLCPEAGTPDVHRAALRAGGATALTRAFTGRRARGIVNRFMLDHPDAPPAYPELHYATAPIRAAARQAGDPEAVNLWAGQAFALARELPAAELVATLAEGR
jgi:nitronate monooxygenase